MKSNELSPRSSRQSCSRQWPETLATAMNQRRPWPRMSSAGWPTSRCPRTRSRYWLDSAVGAAGTPGRPRSSACSWRGSVSLSDSRPGRSVAEATTRKERDRAESEAAIATAINEFLKKDLLARATPYNQSGLGSRPDPDVKLRDVLDLAAGTIGSRFASQPLVEASIQKTIGETYQQLGLYPKALTHLQRALELHRREQGPDHPDTLTAMAGLGSLKLADAKLDEAESLLVPAMDGLLRLRGPVHPDTLAAVLGVAQLPSSRRSSRNPENSSPRSGKPTSECRGPTTLKRSRSQMTWQWFTTGEKKSKDAERLFGDT